MSTIPRGTTSTGFVPLAVPKSVFLVSKEQSPKSLPIERRSTRTYMLYQGFGMGQPWIFVGVPSLPDLCAAKGLSTTLLGRLHHLRVMDNTPHQRGDMAEYDR